MLSSHHAHESTTTPPHRPHHRKSSRTKKVIRNFLPHSHTSHYLQPGDLVLINVPEDLQLLQEVDPCLNGRLAFVQSSNEQEQEQHNMQLCDHVLIKLKPLPKQTKSTTSSTTTSIESTKTWRGKRTTLTKTTKRRVSGEKSSDGDDEYWSDDFPVTSLDNWMYDQYMKIQQQQKQQRAQTSKKQVPQVAVDMDQRSFSTTLGNIDGAEDGENDHEEDCCLFVPKFCLCLEEHILKQRMALSCHPFHALTNEFN